MLLLQGITKPPSSSNFPCIQFVLLCLLCPLKYLQGETCSLIDLAPADLFFASSCMCVLFHLRSNPGTNPGVPSSCCGWCPSWQGPKLGQVFYFCPILPLHNLEDLGRNEIREFLQGWTGASFPAGWSTCNSPSQGLWGCFLKPCLAVVG